VCAQAPARPVAFAGSGQALGGGGAAAAAGPVQAATVTFSVNDSEPTTTIQIRLHDGTRIQQVFNHTHTVGDVYNWVSTATPNAQVKAPAASTLGPKCFGRYRSQKFHSTATGKRRTQHSLHSDVAFCSLTCSTASRARSSRTGVRPLLPRASRMLPSPRWLKPHALKPPKSCL